MLGGTIAAISTPLGKGGVAVIRMSGEGALEIIDKAFKPKYKSSLSDFPKRTQVYGYFMREGERLDDVLVCYFPKDSSYTGEDTVEISCHGGVLVTECILETLFSLGAEPAERGEFTRRAFINGRLSLSDAEAIGSLLEARSLEQVRLSSPDARTRLSESICEIREELVSILSSVYARIDYPDEDLGELCEEEIAEKLKSTLTKIDKLSHTYATARAIGYGISTVIAGKTNAGKSTLYNALVGKDAAIVTDIEGTTRDVLESEVTLGSVILRLRDTAGIRRAADADRVELLGIERSRNMISESELILSVFDVSRPVDESDRLLMDELSHSDGVKICILNKADSALADWDSRGEISSVGFERVLHVSLKSDPISATEAIRKTVEELFTDEKISIGADPVVTTARQNAALTRARDFVNTALCSLLSGLPQDAATSDVELAIGALCEIDSRAVSEEVVADIFSKFCVGK